MKVLFHNSKRTTIQRGNETRDFGIERAVLYDLIKHRQTEEGHIFILSLGGVNWKLIYQGEDYEILKQGAGEDNSDSSLEFLPASTTIQGVTKKKKFRN